MEKIRRASHAGSWYTDNSKKLAEELDGWLRASGLSKSPDVRGVIAPHAGYSYSGRAAAYAFGNIDPTNISRIFLLGPSHHYYTPKCALSTATIYQTPVGDLPIDLEVIEELKATGKFELMDMRVDEAEHSMEMHLPYLAKVFEGHSVKVVPILVGAVSAESEAMYGRLLAKYVDDPKNFFSVSSDFCHWGSRFNYMHYDKKHGAIYKSIEALDHMGMDIIETGDPEAFKKYLQEYDNTICGRHPISVFLHMLKENPKTDQAEKEMAAVSGQLVWEIVKRNNSFLVKEFGRGTAGVQFSKESNNLYNLNSYKHSGLANKKTVTIQPGGKDQSVLLATTKSKKQNKPSSLLHKSLLKKEFSKMAKAVTNQVADNYYRPDLKKAALARLSAVNRSLKVAKSGVKKRNRQALKSGGGK